MQLVAQLGAVISSFGLAAALTLGYLTPAAPAVTNEQLLFLEVRTVILVADECCCIRIIH